ncbi:MAG: type II secretion system protein GspM, partial [Sphingorhabdus sp.]
KRYVDAVERQGRIDSKIAALKQPLGEETVKYSGAIDSFVSQSAGETGIAVGSITPQSENRVNMVVESAKPAALFGWLARIERQGVSVESLSISPSGNEAISATLTLRSH